VPKTNLINEFLKSHAGDSVFFVSGLKKKNPVLADLIYRRAELAAQNGDYAGMRAAFSIYIRQTGQNPENYFQFFNACCALGEFKKAFRTLSLIGKFALPTSQMIEIANPWYNIYNPALLTKLSNKLEFYSAGRNTDVRVMGYLLVLKSAAGQKDALLLRSIFKTFRHASDRAFKKDIWLYFKIAETALNLCFFREACEILKRIIDFEPFNEQAHGRLAEALLCRGQERAAMRRFEKAADTLKTASMPVWHGETLLWLGRYREALGKLNSAICAAYPLAWCWRGAALLKLGRPDEALKNLNTALALKPSDLEARIWRAETFMALKRNLKAMEDLDFVVAVNPTYLWAYVNMTLLNLEGGNFKKALETLKLPPDLTTALALKCRIRPEANYTLPELHKLLEKAKALAKGNRRNEEYLLKLWLK